MRRLLGLALIVMVAAAFAAAQVPASNHVVLILEENHSYSSVVGNTAMPYFNSLIASGALATNYYANTHPSIGNYFMMTAGQIYTNDDSFTSTISIDNMVRHMLGAAKTWKSYAQGLPYAGYTGGNTGYYLKRHNPFAYYSDVANSSVQKMNLVPLTQLSTDLANQQLPEFTYIAPDIMNDMHNGTPQQADSFLSTWVPKIMADPGFQKDGILIITWDESYDTDTANGGGRVATVMVGPGVKAGAKSTTFYQHQSLLKTMLTALGVTTFPGAAANVPLMSDMFGAGTAPAPSPSPAPTAAGVTVSSPLAGSTVASPVHFVASANGGSYPITAMRIYSDNTSVYSVNAASLDTYVTLAGGSHSIVVQAWNTAGQVFKNAFSITVGSTTTSPSPTPTAAGVTVSSPAAGSTVTSPVHFVASANGGSYPISTMRIYSDGSSMYTVNAASCDTYVTLSTGSHNIVVQAWNTAGQVFKNSFTITVGSTTTAPSPTPTATGVTITSPASGAIVGSPVHVTASAKANSAAYITAMRVYVDYTSAYTVNAGSIDTYLNMAVGGHNITINAWDNTGAVYKSSENITVN